MMKNKAIGRLIYRMKEEGKSYSRLQELYEKYRVLKVQITAEVQKTLSFSAAMDLISEYDKAFMEFTGYLHALIDVKYITRDFYYKIFEEV